MKKNILIIILLFLWGSLTTGLLVKQNSDYNKINNDNKEIKIKLNDCNTNKKEQEKEYQNKITEKDNKIEELNKRIKELESKNESLQSENAILRKK